MQLEAYVAARREPEVAQALLEAAEIYRSRAEPLLGVAYDDGTVARDIDPDAFVYFIQTVSLGLMLQRAAGIPAPTGGGWGQLINRIVEGFGQPPPESKASSRTERRAMTTTATSPRPKCCRSASFSPMRTTRSSRTSTTSPADLPLALRALPRPAGHPLQPGLDLPVEQCAGPRLVDRRRPRRSTSRPRGREHARSPARPRPIPGSPIAQLGREGVRRSSASSCRRRRSASSCTASRAP